MLVAVRIFIRDTAAANTRRLLKGVIVARIIAELEVVSVFVLIAEATAACARLGLIWIVNTFILAVGNSICVFVEVRDTASTLPGVALGVIVGTPIEKRVFGSLELCVQVVVCLEITFEVLYQGFQGGFALYRGIKRHCVRRAVSHVRWAINPVHERRELGKKTALRVYELLKFVSPILVELVALVPLKIGVVMHLPHGHLWRSPVHSRVCPAVFIFGEVALDLQKAVRPGHVVKVECVGPLDRVARVAARERGHVSLAGRSAGVLAFDFQSMGDISATCVKACTRTIDGGADVSLFFLFR